MPTLSVSRLANLGAQRILDGFRQFDARFNAITRRAPDRYRECDWRGMQQDATERLAIYRMVVDGVEEDIYDLLGEHVHKKLMWASMKAVYSGLISGLDDWEIAETFFNSITRRIFSTVGVDPQIEFVDTDFGTPPTPSREPVYRTYERRETTRELLRTMLSDYHDPDEFADLERDLALASEAIEEHLRSIGALLTIYRAEVVNNAFYRGNGAYVVGRLFSGSHLIPLAICLVQSPSGIVIDAVLLHEDAVSILFSFARSYFHVAVDRPYDLIRFLKTIIPRKRLGELYIAIGYNKHGKTELYRDLLRHLAYSDDEFRTARGQKGMILNVFTMPNYDLVFKVFRDRFAPPKDMTRTQVEEKYDLVFRHDRVGRLVDTQEFEHLKFDRRHFDDALLEDLRDTTSRAVRIEDEHVVVEHAYVQRRVIPLDIYVQEADAEAAREVAIDYGRAIKDLAVSNIFPGDMLLKNFGVTRHGRVVFYDYDEIMLLTECNFRRMPQAQTYEQALAPEPWFSVGEDDVFPEEFRHFLGFPGDLNDVFVEHHSDLFDPDFWTETQERLRSGEVIHITPYPPHKQLHHEEEPA
ncbi:MAG: bifunctional isocitrate dehydrogenase kinase/phosphatase [Bacteroidetes bacterium]|jgi:isocitrate dehydrogenase kinase/phosphatase|nr:bifunctional isocitrate dehydrogenase kinase/phosphatase [Bacteroidota bacterium]